MLQTDSLFLSLISMPSCETGRFPFASRHKLVSFICHSQALWYLSPQWGLLPDPPPAGPGILGQEAIPPAITVATAGCVIVGCCTSLAYVHLVKLWCAQSKLLLFMSSAYYVPPCGAATLTIHFLFLSGLWSLWTLHHPLCYL